MNKRTKLVLVALLLVALTGTLLAACSLDAGTSTDDLYDKYVQVVEKSGYSPVSKEHFEQVLTAATANGGSVTDISAVLQSTNGTEKWILSLALDNGTIKTAELPATRADSPDPDPTPEPEPDPQPEPTGNDGSSVEKAYTVTEAIERVKKLAQGAHSDGKVYVRGFITSEPNYYETHDSYNFYMGNVASDTSNGFMAYSAQVNGSIETGDEIVIYGYLIHFVKNGNSVYEIGYAKGLDNPQIVKVNGADPKPSTGEHNFPYYFTYGTCTDSGCDVIGRKPVDSTFRNNFKYTLTEANYNTYVGYYTWMLIKVNDASADADEFYAKLDDFVNGLNNVYEQSDIAYVLYQVSGNSTDYDNSNTWYNDLLDKYIDIIVKANDSTNNAIKNGLASNVNKDDIDYAIGSGSDVTSVQAEIDNILAQYNEEIVKESPSANTIANLYGQLVNKNNQLAKLNGYDDYMSYAYENVYNRDYTPAQTKNMSAFVKQYIVPLYNTVNAKSEEAYNALDGNDATDADIDLFNGLMFDSLFTSTGDTYFAEVKNAIDLISDYFKYLDNSGNVRFYNAVEDLFKTGNYFLGQVEGAFTYYMPQVNNTILYFDNTDYGNGTYYYSNAFTFVHEFGHYYENVRNLTQSAGERNLSYDFCETQSQGNEMLFLAWLGGNTTATLGYNAVKYYQLANMLQTVLSATAVDEFEQAVYSGSYEGFTNLNANNYQEVYDTICEKYGISSEDGNDYWMYVCFDNAAYYISYAMSALPAIEIYAKAVAEDGSFDTARSAYLTLFTNKSTDYNTVLDAAGLHNAFDKTLYTDLTNSIK